MNSHHNVTNHSLYIDVQDSCNNKEVYQVLESVSHQFSIQDYIFDQFSFDKRQSVSDSHAF